jgi:hypothetical protein
VAKNEGWDYWLNSYKGQGGSPGAGGGPRGSQNTTPLPGNANAGKGRGGGVPHTAYGDYNINLTADEYLRQLENSAGIMDGLGTTSRAYANANGAQAGLGVPNSTAATQGQPGYGVNPDRSNKPNPTPVGGASLSGGAAAPLDLSTLLPKSTDLNPIYEALIKRIFEAGTNNESQVSESKKAIVDMYDKSSADMYKDYMNSQAGLQGSIAGLGVGSTGDYDQVLRGIEENSNLAENSDLAYLEKMKNARKVNIQDMIVQANKDKVAMQLQQELQQQQAMVDLIAARSGGGGSGGGRGGGSSSNGSTSSSETATETSTLENAGAYDVLMSIEDPTQRAAMLAYLDRAMGNDVTKAIAGDIDAITDKSPLAAKKVGSVQGGTAAKNYGGLFKNQQIGVAQDYLARQLAPLNPLLSSSRGLGSPALAVPSTTRKTTGTAKKTAPKSTAQ